MRVLVLGGTGMLGHKIVQVFSEHFDVYATVRAHSEPLASSGLFNQDRFIPNIDVTDFATLRQVVLDVQPNVVVNCVGIIKQLREAHDPLPSIAINSLLPHQISRICAEIGARLIHVSTDCVFSGKIGNYKEEDEPDPIDLYGRTKWLGEVVDAPHVLTARTSIIGRELSGANALVEWFLSQTGPKVNGYTNAIFSGLPTFTLARTLVGILTDYPDLHGLYHVSAEPINKFDLLELIRDTCGLQLDIIPTPEPVIDRSLNSDRFRQAARWTPQDWPSLIREMFADETPYSTFR